MAQTTSNFIQKEMTILIPIGGCPGYEMGQTLGRIKRHIRLWIRRSIFGAPGPTAGPGNGPGSVNSASCAKHLFRMANLRPIRGQIVIFGVGRKQDETTNVKFRYPTFRGLPIRLPHSQRGDTGIPRPLPTALDLSRCPFPISTIVLYNLLL